MAPGRARDKCRLSDVSRADDGSAFVQPAKVGQGGGAFHLRRVSPFCYRERALADTRRSCCAVFEWMHLLLLPSLWPV